MSTGVDFNNESVEEILNWNKESFCRKLILNTKTIIVKYLNCYSAASFISFAFIIKQKCA